MSNRARHITLARHGVSALLLIAAMPDLSAQVTYLAPQPFDANAVALDDRQRDEAGALPLYGRTLALMARSDAAGTWSAEGNERVWRVGITSPGALALECFIDQAEVPNGAVIGTFAPNGRILSAPVSLDLPAGVAEFSTALVPGDSCILEYREPLDAERHGRFRIASVGHAYRDVHFDDAAREGSCQVNVACHPESDGWEDAIRATVRISVVVPEGTGWCSGTLVNNVRQDCAPYILSAWHCGRTSTAAQFNQYKFYYNFQYATCTGGSYSTAQYMTGAQLKAYSDDYAPQYGGLGGSDFMLLRTNAAVPAGFNPFWAGWDATNIATLTGGGVCTHHPTGAPKRISTFTQPATTGHPMASSGLMSHYKVIWAQTEHGWGITEVGSSGSGLFKQKTGMGPVLIGTCTGNSSGMNCDNHAGTAYFGKMSYSWTNNPNAANIKLKPWLDPDNTGTLVLGGSEHPCAAPSGIASADAPYFPACMPNPANDQLSVRLPNGMAVPADARLMDSMGRLVAQWNLHDRTCTLSTANIPAGAYILQVQAGASEPPSTARILISH